MPTQLLEPVVDNELDQGADDDRPDHWLCVLADDHPYVALCGHLTEGKRTSGQGRLCSTCRDLSYVHGATCAQCAVHVGRY